MVKGPVHTVVKQMAKGSVHTEVKGPVQSEVKGPVHTVVKLMAKGSVHTEVKGPVHVISKAACLFYKNTLKALSGQKLTK